MASSCVSFHLFLLSTVSAFFILGSNAATKTQNRFIFTVIKGEATLQYYTLIDMGTPTTFMNVVIDLGSEFLWFNCDDYNSSTYRHVQCGSPKCEAAKGIGCLGCNAPEKPGCTNNTCGMFPFNPIKNSLSTGGLAVDRMQLSLTDGSVNLNDIDMPRYQFACANTDHLTGLAGQTQGIMGLARSRIALPNQLSSKYNIPPKFALCIPSSDVNGFGVMFVGGGPYFLQFFGEASRLLVQTPLMINPVSTAPISSEGDASVEYFIGVKSITIDGKVVSFNSSLLSIDPKTGNGGTKLSTTAPYTVLHSVIYEAVIADFVKKAALKKMKRVASVAPFGACFSSKNIVKSLTGPGVPIIDLELDGNAASVYWKIYGANSMVKVNKNVLCLGFIDGGAEPRTSIVLGGLQLEDNFLEFDLSTSRLGFSSTLRLHNITCSQSRV